jgi:O-antigen/teichoic acid export membrane protein
MRKNTRHVLQHILWRGLYFFSVLLLNIWIARYFAAEKSGQIFFIINNLSLILLLVGISLESGAAYYIASDKLEASLMANFCLVWATGASFIALVIWGIVLYSMHSAYLANPGFLISSFFFILGVLFTTYFTSLFYAKKEFGLPNKILFLVNIVLIIFLISGRNSIIVRTNFIELYFFSFFLQGFLLRSFFYRKYAYKGNRMFPATPLLKRVIRYALYALTANLVYFLVNRIDYWFVEYYCSKSALGNYIQASRLAQMLLILPSILASTLFPIFSSQENSGTRSQLTAALRVLLWMNTGICVLIIAAGWYFIPLVFGSSFSIMYILFIYLIPGILCTSMNYPLSAWFSAANRIGVNIRGALLALMVICTGDIFLLPHAGIIAAPVVSSAGYFSYYCYTLYMYRKENKVSWNELLIIRKSDLLLTRQAIESRKDQFPPEGTFVQNSTT